MGDLNLLHEIRLSSDSGVVDRDAERSPARRVYSARVHGSKSKMAVAVYEGDAEEVCSNVALVEFMVIPPELAEGCFTAFKLSVG
ncbi:hypothetical protein B0H17DRAFT_124143 [Mycena rosella]|uniref:Uncharacterized protein n=1 Tax=Mycena rosella TaxID=1033263 RepID=A0AAD7D341_MYCRO|nr:hypothetical protein B0H17DRAFT_124143 [Mycena rosella]